MAEAAAPAVYRAAWERKPALREIYLDCYRRMAAACRPGPTLEIGGGSGNFKQFAPEVVSTDIQSAAWLDVVCDGQALPFTDRSFDNVVLFDVLHHLHRPRLFFAEAERVLRPGGRIVMVEPAVTPVSWMLYKLFHAEPIAMGDDPLAAGPAEAGRDPYVGNQGIPSALFGRHRGRFEAMFPGLAVTAVERFALFAYPLSGGFRPWCLVPAALVGPMLRLEAVLSPLLGPLMAFRLLAVVERRREAR